jgi:hypothetical protein
VGVLKNGFLAHDNPSEGDMTDGVNATQAATADLPGNPAPGISKPAPGEVAIQVGPGVKVVFSDELMIHVATAKFSKGIEQLSKDLDALNAQQSETAKVGSHEEAES